MNVRNEYEVTVEPTGHWKVCHIHGERASEVATGNAHPGIVDDPMEIAEEEARAWIRDTLKELEDSHEYRKRCKVFSVPATIGYLHGKRVR